LSVPPPSLTLVPVPFVSPIVVPTVFPPSPAITVPSRRKSERQMAKSQDTSR
jgi:hypothetical protein